MTTPSETLNFFALTSGGRRFEFQIPRMVDAGADFIGAVHSSLMSQGAAEEELKGMVISSIELEHFPPDPASVDRRMLSHAEVASQTNLPPIPLPTGPDDLPPAVSPSIVVSTNDIPLFIYFWGDEGPDHGSYFAVTTANTPPLSLSPSFPSPSRIAYNRYWLNAGNYIIVGPQTFSQSITTTEGMSVTDSTTLSAEVGVAVGDLSAKLSATTSHSVTISNDQSQTQTYTLPETPAGKTCVYTLWQLVDEFILVDGNNNPIQWSGKLNAGLFGAGFPANFPNNMFANNTRTYASSPVTF